VITCGLAAELAQSSACDSASRDSLGNPVTNPGRAVPQVIEVEATNDRSVAVDEHVKDADAGVLLNKERIMMFRQRFIELIATIGN
jgi:hypothetical protein